MSASTFATRRLGGPDEPPAGRGRVPYRRLILTTGVIALVGAVLAWLVFFSSVLGVRTIKVTGVRALTVEQVTRAAGISHGSPLIRLDTGAVEHRIEALPDVASATVSTSFPSTVTITVVERVPVGVLQVANGFVMVDKSGDQYRTVPSRPVGLPLFVVPPGTSAKDTGGAVATVAVALGTHLRGEITSIQALDPDAISILMSNGIVVAWGSATQNDLKARVLSALLAQPGAHQIDVTDPSAPFTR
jgi:cell division protein FtsQ